MDINQIANTLQKIVGPIAREGWDAYVRQQYVIGIQEVVWAIIVFVGGLVAAVVATKARRALKKFDDEKEAFKKTNGYYPSWGTNEDAFVTLFVSLIAVAVIIIIDVALCVDAFGHFFNPEYGAIQGILGR